MKRAQKYVAILEKIAYYIEAVLTFLLLTTIVILLVELFLKQLGISVEIIAMDFDSILSNVFTLVVGVEFTKMLCKHTPETVIEVLLFATARQMVLSHGNMTSMLMGVVSIAGLFAIKKFLFLPSAK